MTYQQPDSKGFYGRFGGRFVPETLMTAVLELDQAYRQAKKDPAFQAELADLLKDYVGRETPLYFAKRLTGRRVEAIDRRAKYLVLRLDDGMVVELGRQQAKAPVFQRLTRFVEHYPELLAVGGKRPAVVDMRYPNGFALRFAAASGNEGKGKP